MYMSQAVCIFRHSVLWYRVPRHSLLWYAVPRHYVSAVAHCLAVCIRHVCIIAILWLVTLTWVRNWPFNTWGAGQEPQWLALCSLSQDQKRSWRLHQWYEGVATAEEGTGETFLGAGVDLCRSFWDISWVGAALGISGIHPPTATHWNMPGIWRLYHW